MNDPYQTLGVSRNDSEETIKKAYRELARKYHPDNYANNPLSDLAQEKMKEINEAYDEIMRGRTSGGAGSSARGSRSYGTGAKKGGDPFYNRIRNLINMGNTGEAEKLLDGVSMGERNAEWHFCKGCVNLKKGFVNDARAEFTNACNMDPTDSEYAAALNRLNNMNSAYGGGGYRPYYGGGYGTGGMSACDCCSNLICADCCCECMGGDLVPCV